MLVASALNFVIISHCFENLMVAVLSMRKSKAMNSVAAFKFCDVNWLNL
nr:MAG TPA: hypothetical protein [Caudoviricetes sp.]